MILIPLIATLNLVLPEVASANVINNMLTAGHVAIAPSGTQYIIAGGAFIVPSKSPPYNQFYWVGTSQPTSGNRNVIQAGVLCNANVCLGEWGTGEPGSLFSVNFVLQTAFPVSPGDFITATVHYLGNSFDTFSLFNNTRNTGWSFTAYVPVYDGSAATFAVDDDQDLGNQYWGNCWYASTTHSYPLTPGPPTNNNTGNDLWEILIPYGWGIIPTPVASQSFFEQYSYTI